jgi:hypothetical protein
VPEQLRTVWKPLKMPQKCSKSLEIAQISRTGWFDYEFPRSVDSLFTPVATSGTVVGSGAPPMDPRFVTGLVFMRKNPWILIYATWHGSHGSARAGMR